MLYKRKGLVEQISPQGTQHYGGNFYWFTSFRTCSTTHRGEPSHCRVIKQTLTGSRYNRITSIDKHCVSHRLLDVPTLMLWCFRPRLSSSTRSSSTSRGRTWTSRTSWRKWRRPPSTGTTRLSWTTMTGGFPPAAQAGVTPSAPVAPNYSKTERIVYWWMQWRAVHFTSRPSLTSYLVHP